MRPPFQNRMTGELFNEKYSIPVGRHCSELFPCTAVCRSWPVWLFQVEVVLLRAVLPAARAMLCPSSNMLCTCTCVLCATAML